MASRPKRTATPETPKIAESRHSATAPPMNGPTSSPTISQACSLANPSARFSGPLRSTTAARSAGTYAPDATPCSVRSAASSQSGPTSANSANESTPKAAREPSSMGRRPSRSVSRPAGTWTSMLAISGPAMNRAIASEPPPWRRT